MSFGEILKAMLNPSAPVDGPVTHTFVPADPWEGWEEGDPEPAFPPDFTIEEG